MMGGGLLLQYVLVALALIASTAYVLQKQFPAGLRRLRIALAIPLLREGRAGWLRACGVALAPAPLAGAPGCHRCDKCG
jgi:hypothetical protein